MTKQPKFWKNAFVLLVVIALIIIGRLALQLQDQSATLDMYRDESRRVETALSVLRTAMPAVVHGSGRVTQADILAILQKQNPSAQIVSGPSKIEMDELRFCFAADGSLDRIERTDDYGTSPTGSPTNRDTVF